MIFAALLIVPSMKAKSKTLTVGPGKTYSTIGAAVSNANFDNGDTIKIDPGTYHETVTINGSMTIESDPSTTTASNPVIVDGGAVNGVFNINSASATVTLQGLVIQNGARGIGNSASLTINECLIRNNHSPNQGGGLLSSGGTVVVMNSTFLSNSAIEGGAVQEVGNGTFTNCTFVNNSASEGGAFLEDVEGISSFTNCTFIRNTSADGSAIAVAAGTVKTQNCLLAYNRDNSSTPNNCATVSSGTYTSLGHNLSTDGTCGGGPGDQLNVTDIQAGPLLDNPGTTLGYIPPTYALHSHSPAVDAGDNSGAPSTDERGVARDSQVDIGAFEYNGTPADLTAAPTCGYTFDVSGSTVTDVQVTYQDTDPNDGIDTFDFLSDTNDAPTLQIGSGSAFGTGVGLQVTPLDNRNDPLVLTSTKQDTGSGVTFTVNVEDFDGNHADCTAPIFTSIAIRQSGGSYRQTFQNLTPEQGNVHLLNGDQGIDQLEVQVNGHDYMLTGLTPDQSADLDLTPAMQEGNANEVTLIGTGPVGSQAFALIGNGTIVRTDGPTTPEAGSTSILPGDVNGDGTVNVADAILLLKAVVGEQPLTAREMQAVGSTGNRPVTVADVVALLRKGVGE